MADSADTKNETAENISKEENAKNESGEAVTTDKKQRRYLAAAAVFAVLLIASVSIYVAVEYGGRAASESVLLYYYNSHSGEWETEAFVPKQSGLTDTELAAAALERLQRVSEQITGGQAVPRGMVLEQTVDGSTYFVWLSEDFNTLSVSERNMAVASIVYTLTDLDFIDDVVFFVGSGNLEMQLGGAAMGPLNRERLALSSEQLPGNTGSRTVRLYFADALSEKLAALERDIELQPNKPLENHLIEELITGSDSKEYTRLIPADVKLRDNARFSGGVCYVDFQTDFLLRFDNVKTLELVVYSIVNTVIDNTSAVQVQLLFAGDRTAAVIEGVDLGNPLSYKELY